MRALVIAPQPFFTPRGTPFSVYYRTLITAELGVKVDLLTYGQGEDVAIPGVRLVRVPHFRLFGNVKTGPSFLKLVLDGFLSVWTLALLLRYRYQFVHAHEEAVFFARLLKPIFRFKLVYDMHSSLPEQLENFKFTKSRVITSIFRFLEDSCLRSADAVITICPALAEYVNGRIVDAGKHLLIENSIFDPVNIVKRELSGPRAVAFRRATDIRKGNLVIVYAGTLEHYQGIVLLLHAFKKVATANADVYLFIVGGTDEQVEHYSRIAGEACISERCCFTGRVSPEIARQYNLMATLLISPRITGLNTPLKIYEQLASGIPLVATNIYAHTQVLDNSVAFLAEPRADELARAILQALLSKRERQRKAGNAKRLYRDKYSRSVYVAKMQHLLALLK
jgi:glycosyltransferase involved in cell wall biosynthesis